MRGRTYSVDSVLGDQVPSNEPSQADQVNNFSQRSEKRSSIPKPHTASTKRSVSCSRDKENVSFWAMHHRLHLFTLLVFSKWPTRLWDRFISQQLLSAWIKAVMSFCRQLGCRGCCMKTLLRRVCFRKEMRVSDPGAVFLPTCIG